jgi:type V secretory pathway adhesin AidA
VLKSGGTTITTITLTADDSFGKMYSYDMSSKSPASTYSISFTGAAGETSTGNIHVVMVSNYQLPPAE